MRSTLLKTIPMDHQYKSIAFAVENHRVALWLDIGVGKTLTAIYSAVLLNCKSVLVVCPNSVIRTWRDEIVKHTDLILSELTGSAQDRRCSLNVWADFFVINYEGLKSLWAEKVVISRGKNKDKKKYMPLKEIGDVPFDCLIVDESQGLRDPAALQTLICGKLAQKCKYVMLLTGTPDDGKLKGLWGQYWVIDSGDALGKSYWGYLRKFFNPVKFNMPFGSFTEWVPRYDSLDKVMNLVASKTVRFDRRDCFDLPPVVFQKREIEPSQEQKTLATAIKNDLKSELMRHGIDLRNVSNKSMKLMQLTGGFVLSGGKATLLKQNPKLDELMDVLRETSSKVIVYHTFVEEGRMIETRLKKEGIKFASMRGEINDTNAQYVKFKTDPQVKVLVAHPKSGGVGLNLQEANVIIFFSLGMISPTARKQAIGRIDRLGQTSTCTVIDFTMKGTVDEVIFTALEKGMDLSQAILDWLRN